MPELDIDLLVLIVVSESQSKKLMSNLNKQQFFFTIINSTNSLFHEPTVCLLLGLNHTRIEALNDLVQTYCQPYRSFVPVQMRTAAEISHLSGLETQEGGATLFTLPVEHFEQY
jgi:uncharacterized protein YaaQ